MTVDRREFFRRTALLGASASAFSFLSDPAPAEEPQPSDSPNEKLNIGCIGVAGKGASNIAGVSTENIVALCDIDEKRLAGAAAKFPQAKTYSDYRRLLDQSDLDAVVVSTPDHSHAIPVVWALKRGLDVYCEKPLAHDVYEVRQMRSWAGKQLAVTQMGTQIHAGDNYRRAVEIVQSGLIGPVRRVVVWHGNRFLPGKRVKEATPPSHIDYDLWTGPAPMRPFHESHFHFNWRYWWDFGGGILADMACHYMDLPFWALGLRYPERVVARGEKNHPGDNDVPNQMTVDWHFPARGSLPPVHLTWHHGTEGNWQPDIAEQYPEYRSAVLFIGDRGRLIADYGRHKLYLEGDEKAEVPPAFIPNSIGHHQEWVQACKTRGATTCNFDYSGALAEAVLLGNVSYRLGKPVPTGERTHKAEGVELDWDAENLQARNAPAAEPLIRREYRKGWTL